MGTSAITILPIFLIIIFAFFVGRSKHFDSQHATVITQLVFYIVLPVTLLKDIAQTPLSEALNPFYLATYICASIVLILLTIFVSRTFFQRDARNTMINIMSCYYSNTAYLALPLFLLLFHQVAGVSGILLIQVISFVCLLLYFESTDQKHSDTVLIKLIPKVIFKNPLIIAIFIGLALNILHIELPNLLIHTFNLFSDSATFLAVFALGLSLAATPLRFNKHEAGELLYLLIAKSFLQPLLAYLIGHYIFHLSQQWLLMVVLMAAMPSAMNLFIVADRYRIGEKRSQLLIAVTTLLSFFTINWILWLLR